MDAEWMYREWSDAYPDTLSVQVQRDSADGRAFVVVSGSAVWLSPEQVAEVIQHLSACRVAVEEFNSQL